MQSKPDLTHDATPGKTPAGEQPEEQHWTYFVHLDTAETIVVNGVTGIYVTDSAVVLRRAGQAPAVYARASVFFACRGCDLSPPCWF